jgi:hypothetical protein
LEIVLGLSTQLFKEFNDKLIKIGKSVEQVEFNVKNACRNYIAESTNFLKEAVRKQAERVILELKTEPDPTLKELCEGMKAMLKDQNKSLALLTKTLLELMALIKD